MILVVFIWATSEYHNAGGWPANGFGQSSGTPNVWNYWIIYPLIAWALGFLPGIAPSPWGWIGVVPLLTAVVGYCPAYSILGMSTCSKRA